MAGCDNNIDVETSGSVTPRLVFCAKIYAIFS
jgi:hypothetical protein